MTDKARKSIERGDRAKALLNNELLQDAFQSLEAGLIKAWKESAADEMQRRDDAWRSLKLLENLRKGLEKAVTDGEYSAKQLLQIKERSLAEKVMKR